MSRWGCAYLFNRTLLFAVIFTGESSRCQIQCHNETHAVAPREHRVLGLRPRRNQVIPPYGGWNSCLFGGGSKHTTAVALRELSSLIIEIL